MYSLRKQNILKTREMSDAEFDRTQRFLKKQYEQFNAVVDMQLTNDEIKSQDTDLKEHSEENGEERWMVNAAWEVRQFGYVSSNKEEWIERFIKDRSTRPEAESFQPPKEDDDSVRNVNLRLKKEHYKREEKRKEDCKKKEIPYTEKPYNWKKKQEIFGV